MSFVQKILVNENKRMQSFQNMSEEQIKYE